MNEIVCEYSEGWKFLTHALRSDSVKFHFIIRPWPLFWIYAKTFCNPQLSLESHWNPDFLPDFQDLQCHNSRRILGTSGLQRFSHLLYQTAHFLITLFTGRWFCCLLVAISLFQTGLEYGQMSTSHLLSKGMGARIYLYIKTHFGTAWTHPGITCIYSSGQHDLNLDNPICPVFSLPP